MTALTDPRESLGGALPAHPSQSPLEPSFRARRCPFKSSQPPSSKSISTSFYRQLIQGAKFSYQMLIFPPGTAPVFAGGAALAVQHSLWEESKGEQLPDPARKGGWEGGGIFWPNCPSLRLVLPCPRSQQAQPGQSSWFTSRLGTTPQFRLKAIKFRWSHSAAQTSRDPTSFPHHLDINRGNPFRALLQEGKKEYLLTSSREVQAPGSGPLAEPSPCPRSAAGQLRLHRSESKGENPGSFST